MPLIESLLHDGIDEWAAVEQHPFARLMIVLLGYLLPAMRISFPESPVLDFLNLKKLQALVQGIRRNRCGKLSSISYPHDVVANEEATRLAIITMIANCGLHFFFNSKKFFVVGQ